MKPALALVSAALIACGGQVAGSDAGTGTSSGGSPPGTSSGASGSSSGVSPSPSGTSPPSSSGSPTPVFDAGPVPVTCLDQGGGGSSSSGGGCTVSVSEMCSDGTTYQATCSCPSDTCSCSASSPGAGSSGGGLPFGGCAAGCGSEAQAYAACGFPH